MIKKTLQLAIILALAAACGSTNPSPVGIDLVDLAGGDVVEISNIRPVESRSIFRQAFPSVLGKTEELLVGRMNGISYLAAFRFDLSQVSGNTDAIRSGTIELTVLGDGLRGSLSNVEISTPAEAWDESTAFVKGQDTIRTGFERRTLATVSVTQIDSTLRIPVPGEIIAEAMDSGSSQEGLELIVSGSELESPFVAIVGSREVELPSSGPKLVLDVEGMGLVESVPSLDTYYADLTSDPGDDTILLHTGVIVGGLLRFDLPSIPSTATVRVVELSLDLDGDRSLTSGIRTRVERLDVASEDTTFVGAASYLDGQLLLPGQQNSIFLDQLLFQRWMTGSVINQGLLLTPSSETSTLELRYEWGLFVNPRLRIVYSLAPQSGGS